MKPFYLDPYQNIFLYSNFSIISYSKVMIPYTEDDKLFEQYKNKVSD